jgi:hypothetical protein
MNFAEEDKASIGFFNNLIYLPPYLLEKYLAPTAKAIKKVNDLANTLFSEPDAAIYGQDSLRRSVPNEY